MKKGSKHSPEAIEKMSQSHKGSTSWCKGMKTGRPAWNRGKKMGVSFRKGKKFPEISGDRHWTKRKSFSLEAREKMRQNNLGEKSRFWKDGRASHPKYASWYARTRTLRMRGNGGSHTLKEWDDMKKRYCFTCPCCLKVEPDIVLTKDHIIALSRGGTDDISNIQPLCDECNKKKYTKSTKYAVPDVELYL